MLDSLISLRINELASSVPSSLVPAVHLDARQNEGADTLQIVCDYRLADIVLEGPISFLSPSESADAAYLRQADFAVRVEMIRCRISPS